MGLLQGARQQQQLRKTLEQLIAAQPDDRRLRDHIERLSLDDHFPGLSWFWGPRLYERNRAVFRPFILNHFSDWAIAPNSRRVRIGWSDHEESLDEWLAKARTNRDTALVRQLLRWKYASSRWGVDQKRWTAALLTDFKNAPTAAARAIVLDEYDDWFSIDELTASALYRIDAGAADYILKHLPHFYWNEKKRQMWPSLGELARDRGDDAFYYTLYRKLMPLERWSAEVETLAQAIADPDKLNEALELRHIEGYGLNRTPIAVSLLERRGRDVFPYIRMHLRDFVGVWRSEGVEKLVSLAAKKGWWDLWAAALRTCANRNLHGKALGELLDDRGVGEDDRLERLRALAGVSREWNWPGIGIAVVHSLEDDLAARLYKLYPDLVRGPFLPQVTPRWWGGYPKLLAAAQAKHDDELVDIMASRYITKLQFRWSRSDKPDRQLETAASLATYYTAIRDRDPVAFALRAANVLTRIPAYVAYDFNQLLRTNALARLMFVRSFEVFLTVPRAVRDLVEGSNIHVQKLAYQILAADDDRARALALDNLDILIGTLLRPIHRKTRLPAFDALSNAAKADLAAAQRILTRAREALRLPDKRYPKAELIAMIAQILAAQPSLRDASEEPVIYGLEEQAA